MPETPFTAPEAPSAAPAVAAEAGPERPVKWVEPESEPVERWLPDGQLSGVAPVQASPLLGAARGADLEQHLRAARTLAAEGKPETLTVALQLYDRAALAYGDVWREAYERERVAITERLARFVRFYPQAAAALGGITRADMRYPNGFAAHGEGQRKEPA